jgi:hypothetical protein
VVRRAILENGPVSRFEIRRARPEDLEAAVGVWERARSFYERRGFRAVQFGVSPPPESEPDVRYAWDPSDGG